MSQTGRDSNGRFKPGNKFGVHRRRHGLDMTEQLPNDYYELDEVKAVRSDNTDVDLLKHLEPLIEDVRERRSRLIALNNVKTASAVGAYGRLLTAMVATAARLESGSSRAASFDNLAPDQRQRLKDR